MNEDSVTELLPILGRSRDVVFSATLQWHKGHKAPVTEEEDDHPALYLRGFVKALHQRVTSYE